MNIFRVNELKPDTVLDCSLYSSADGTKFLQAGIEFTQDLHDLLRRRKEEEVYGLNREEELAVDLEHKEMPTVVGHRLNLDALEVDTRLPRGIYDCKGIVLWATEAKEITGDDLKRLHSLDEAAPGSIYLWDGDRLFLRDDRIVRAVAAHLSRIQAHAIEKRTKKKPTKELSQISSSEPLQEYMQKSMPRERTAQEKGQMVSHYDQSLNQLDDTLRPINTKGTLRIRSTSVRQQQQMVQDTVEIILRDSEMAANLLNQASGKGGYLKSHAFKVSVLSMEVATAMGFSKQEVINLGLASLLQDLGMVRLSETLLNKTTPLVPSEWEAVHQHPVHSAEVLGKTRGLPKDVIGIVLQAHERLDGSGYPTGLSGDQIYPLAKVLAVVNVYIAIISPRPYRPAHAAYDAVYTLLQSAHHRLLEREVVKALLGVLSLFPVGTLVELNTGEIARVVGTNAGAYTRPAISVITNTDREVQPPRMIDLLTTDDLEIVRIVEPDELPEIDVMYGF